MLMRFRSIGRSIARTLLVALLASALIPLTHADDNVCPDTCMGWRYDNIEDRLHNIQHTLPTWTNTPTLYNPPQIKENCTVYLASYGKDDWTLEAYVRTSADGSDVTHAVNDRGVTLFELDVASCTVINRETFDTMFSSDNTTQLLEALGSAKTGTVIVAVTADCVDYYQGPNLVVPAGPFFTRYNMNMAGLGFRDKLAFLMKRGYPKKTQFQWKAKGEDNLKMIITFSGTNTNDVSFNSI